MNRQKGFTLVELAIVMTIIGLLIGGILKGQELLENARVTATIAQIKSYQAAVTAFRDIYDALPGDGMPNAADKLPGCNANCNTPPAQANNGFIDGNSFEEQLTGTARLGRPPTNSYDEGLLFWIHLLKANLVAGFSDTAIHEDADSVFGVTLPAAKTGGGFVVGSSPTDWQLGFLSWNYIVLVGAPVSAGTNYLSYANTSTRGDKAVTPSRAAQIDRKVDDGMPVTGDVVSAIYDACYTNDNGDFVDPASTYLEASSAKDCVVSYRIR